MDDEGTVSITMAFDEVVDDTISVYYQVEYGTNYRLY